MAKVARNWDPESRLTATLLDKVGIWRAHKTEYAATQRTGKGQTGQAGEGNNGYQKLMPAFLSCP